MTFATLNKYRVVNESDPYSADDGPYPGRRVAIYGPDGLVICSAQNLTYRDAVSHKYSTAHAFEAGYREAFKQLARLVYSDHTSVEIEIDSEK